MTEDKSKSAQPTRRAKQPIERLAQEAWRYTVASDALAAMLILIVNIITLTVMYAKYSLDGDQITFYMGSCKRAKVLTTGTHLIVNILSTILLASSNFSIQCLNSPTRKEIDIAHSQHKALNIGIPSIRNLFFVCLNGKCCFGLSLLPVLFLCI